jgi:hypothetical protein
MSNPQEMTEYVHRRLRGPATISRPDECRLPSDSCVHLDRLLLGFNPAFNPRAAGN